MQGAAEMGKLAAIALVNRAAKQTGSRMPAYRKVARQIGASPEWLRKYISSPSAREPRVTVWFNIIQLYRQTCERVEDAAERERLLGEKLNALAKSVGPLVVQPPADAKERHAGL